MQIDNLKKSLDKDEEILEEHVRQTIVEDLKTFDMQMEIHYAHVVMLYEQGIITKDEASKILGALLEVSEKGPSIIQLKPGLTDLYSNLEEWIIDKVGLEIGGKLHTGRSRNDMNLTIERMYTRMSLIKFSEAVCKLMETLLEQAEEHIKTVIPGYTHHSQHAQPTTLGHFYMAAFKAFERDLDRAYNSYKHTNICPMGGAALTTTGFNLNRNRVSDLLAFNKPIENSMDATSSLDFQHEAASCMAIFINNVGRMIESFLIWNIREVGLVRLAAKYCSYSTIMPQKRNPVALETLRYSGEWTYGALSTMFNTLKAFTPGNGREPGFVTSLYIEIAEKIINSAYLLEGIVRTLEVNKERGLQLAKEGFSTMTELADEMVRSKGLSFSAAKRVVGKLVLIAHEENIACEDIDSKLLNKASLAILGKTIDMSDEEIKKALDPIENVRRRNLLGGPAFEETGRMIKEGYRQLGEIKENWAREKARLEEKSTTLHEIVNRIIS